MTPMEDDQCVHCGLALDQHTYSSFRRVFWRPGSPRRQIYMAPWHAWAGWCVRCGWDRAHHVVAADGRALCHWCDRQTFLAATPALTVQQVQSGS